MKKILCALMLLILSAGSAFPAGTTYNASSQEKKRMSEFISAFTEAGLFNFDMKTDFDEDEDEQEGEPKTHLGMPENITELARFGIVNNLIRNRKKVINCTDKNCESGSLKVDKKFVAESVRKYFGVEMPEKNLRMIADDESAVFSYDGKFFHFDPDIFSEPGNDTIYYADVQGVIKEGRNLSFAGDIYNSRKTTDRPGMFAATVRPSGKSWVIIDITTDWVTNAGRD